MPLLEMRINIKICQLNVSQKIYDLWRQYDVVKITFSH